MARDKKLFVGAVVRVRKSYHKPVLDRYTGRHYDRSAQGGVVVSIHGSRSKMVLVQFKHGLGMIPEDQLILLKGAEDIADGDVSPTEVSKRDAHLTRLPSVEEPTEQTKKAVADNRRRVNADMEHDGIDKPKRRRRRKTTKTTKTTKQD